MENRQNTANEVEELEGCMCQYIPENLREQIYLVADKASAYDSQVVCMALQIGLGVLIGKHSDILNSTSRAKHETKIKQRRRVKLSGEGI